MADRYIRNTGGNYNAAGTWELTPGGGESVAVPTSSDFVKCTATSGPLTVTATANCISIDLTSYTNTLTLNTAFGIFIYGNATLGVGMTYTGLGFISFQTGGTLTTNGITISGSLDMSSGGTVTVVGNVVVTGVFSAAIAGTLTINKTTNETISCNGIALSASGTVQGTIGFILTGGTWSGGTGTFKCNVTFNSIGTITLGATVIYNTGTLTYTAGTIDATTNSNVLTIGSLTTLNTNGMTFNRVNFIPSSASGMTITLSSNFQAITLNYFYYKTTFSGAYDITTTNLMMFPASTSNVEIVLVASSTLNISGKIECYGTTNYIPKITSATPSSNANISYTGNRQQNIIACSFTDINATGQTLWYVAGTQTRVTNITQLQNVSLTPLTTANGF